MKELVTPKQAAQALRVSESSVKRWCDKGVIPTQHTAGGHRRIPVAGLLEFLRGAKQPLVRPEALGLPSNTGSAPRMLERAAAQMTEALVGGDEVLCRRIALDLYLARLTLSAICDDVLAEAFEKIGDLWECGEAEVYQERRGCEIALRVLHELRALSPAQPEEGPLAIGGAGEGDQYSLATSMAELVLRDAGWRAVSLGDNLPFETLAAAIKAHRPRLFWLSCSHIADEERFLSGYSALYDEFHAEVAIVVGGRALVEPLRRRMKYAAFCDNMRHLEAFAQTVRGS